MKFTAFLLMSCSLFLSAASYAAEGVVKGTVEQIQLQDGALNPQWNPPRFWFTLNLTTPVGTCPMMSGKLLFDAASREAYLAVLGAYLTGKEIAITYNDVHQSGGICRATHITLGNTPLN